MRFPHFDFYPRDWANDANNQYQSLAAQGAHINLLALMWNEATDDTFGLLDNDRGIARALGISLAEWQELRATLIDGPYAVFAVEAGRIVSGRLREEWQKALDRSQKATQSRSQRTLNERSTNVERTLNERTYERTTTHHAPDSRHRKTDPDPEREREREGRRAREETKSRPAVTDANPKPQAAGGQAPRRRPPERPADPRVQPVLTYFDQQHRAAFGVPYPVEPGKDGALIRRLPKALTVADLEHAIDVFFADADPYYQRAGKTLGTFRTALPKLLQRIRSPTGPGIDLGVVTVGEESP